jgi:hypothetical protein
MMQQKFIDILDDCLSRLDRGEVLLDVLDVYPSLEDKLKPLLLIAMLSRALPQPAPHSSAIRRGKNLMLAEMNRMQAERATQSSKARQPVGEVVDGLLENIPNVFQPDRVGSLSLGYRTAIVALVLVMSGSLLTLNVSASELPGGVFGNLAAGFERIRTVLLYGSSPPEGVTSTEEVSPDGEFASLDDTLAGKPGNPDTKPGVDPTTFVDGVIPGLVDFSLSSNADKDKPEDEAPFVEDDPYEEQEDLDLEELDDSEDEDKDKDNEEIVEDEKVKKDKKDKDKIKKDKDKDK